MAEYISREALLEDIDEAVKHRGMGEIIGQTLRRYILRQPVADVVEVVRCKDCEYCRSFMSGDIYCTHSEGLTSQGLDAFCSYGKRREE